MTTEEFGQWRKSTRTQGDNNCVELAHSLPSAPARTVGVRDSKNRTGPVLVFSAAAAERFLRSAAAGLFD
ncbi:DUF397 domain-containing protein [Lentzea guizhouensis]|uniref:DUF397 domain-containing protein n=1 Tax=Lentzea guizhouensis TaxID=1586287 RepID=UPI0008FF2D8F|nr:DUF397 domain-containing protein [Lentzea guizhouensis]